MSIAATDYAAVFAALGGERHAADRRSGVPMRDDSIVVLLSGSVQVFAYRKGHRRRHRIGELLPGSAVQGPVFPVDLIPESTAEFLRLPAGALAAAASHGPAAEALRQGFAKTLAGCGGTLSPKVSLADAAKRVTEELERRGQSTSEAAYARHMRRLVDVASGSLAFEQRIQSLVTTRTGPRWMYQPDSRLPPVVRACIQLAVMMGYEPDAVPTRIPRDVTRKTEQTFAHVAGLGIRTVFLDPGWWLQDIGSVLAFRAEDQAPVAVLATPQGLKAFVHSSGAIAGPFTVDEAFASTLAKSASQFHATLGPQRISVWKFLRFIAKGSEHDFLLAFIMAGLGVLVSLAIPVGTGLLISRVIPSENHWGLLFIGMVLLATTVTSAACSFVVSNLLLRAETRMDGRALGGILDRCLRMPVEAFRTFTSGDLADRILSVGNMQQLLSGSAVAAIMAGVFSVVYLSVMAAVDSQAAVVGFAFMVIAVLVSVLISLKRAQLSMQSMESQGGLSTVMLQYIGGIDALRGAASDQFAVLRWLEKFRVVRTFSMRIHRLDRFYEVFSAGFPVLCTTLFWIIFSQRFASPDTFESSPIDAPVRVAQFVMFTAAFSAALFSVLDVGTRLGDLALLQSTFRRIRPILDAEVESSGEREVPGVISGQITIADVRFAYPGSANEILSGVSIRIEAGESVAVVGPSGSGKSTLLQLVLGLRKPTSGNVLLDGKDLDRLDLVSVRRQIGAVVQNTRIVPGAILENIVGSTLHGVDDAQRALEAAGFADEVERMPMGVHTYVTDQTLSGGQLQKLLIARALVARPKILVFDEATSALDEISQAQVVASLEGLRATRIIVAHRLSTVRSCDRIFVMDAGRVVQVGTFDDLVRVEGRFREMARRQMLDVPPAIGPAIQ
ncbi:MAG: ATP-binding cassette domain-containing protein [Planctomycetes bacterium]|nr:ATP-binding cassette domain-containing protein [Planctomycetota bacterium]